MDQAKELFDQITEKSKHPAMVTLEPEMSLVGSMPEGTRAGEVVEIDVMLQMKGFQKEFLIATKSATKLTLSQKGKAFFGKLIGMM